MQRFRKLSTARNAAQADPGEFTEDERELLEDLPIAVGMAVSYGDKGGGPISDRREFGALLRALHDVSRGFYGNLLIHRVFEKHGGLAGVNVRAMRHEDFDDGFGGQRFTADAMQRVLDKCVRAHEVLAKKASRKDVDEYKRYVLIVGLKVAEASGSGPLGTGQKVSAREREILDGLADALQFPRLMW